MRVGQFRPEVLAAVSQAPSVKKQVRVVSREIVKIARRKSARRTGAMAKGLRVENVYDRATGMVEDHVGWDKHTAWWGPLVELGTEDTPAQPALRPAADEINNRR